jgi:hypothetical protein
MPTHDELPRFLNDLRRLTPQQRQRFADAVKLLVADLRAKQPYRKSLRVKTVQGYQGIFEMTWDWPDGRATFEYGPEQKPGERHIVWRRIGRHEIFDAP